MHTEACRPDVTQEEEVRQFFEGIGLFDHLVCTAVAGTVLYPIPNAHTTGTRAEVNARYRVV